MGIGAKICKSQRRLFFESGPEPHMTPFPTWRIWLAIAALMMGVVLVIYFEPFSRLTGDREALTDVRGIQTLRDQFNRDAGKARLILLLSPT